MLSDESSVQGGGRGPVLVVGGRWTGTGKPKGLGVGAFYTRVIIEFPMIRGLTPLFIITLNY